MRRFSKQRSNAAECSSGGRQITYFHIVPLDPAVGWNAVVGLVVPEIPVRREQAKAIARPQMRNHIGDRSDRAAGTEAWKKMADARQDGGTDHPIDLSGNIISKRHREPQHRVWAPRHPQAHHPMWACKNSGFCGYPCDPGWARAGESTVLVPQDLQKVGGACRSRQASCPGSQLCPALRRLLAAVMRPR